jgi:hypothetical protein
MSSVEITIDQAHPRSDFRTPFESTMPPTPGELAASSARMERRGLLQRLVRVN